MSFFKKDKWIRTLCLVVGCLLLFRAGHHLWAQDHFSQIDEFEKKARDIDREIEESEAKIEKFTRKEADIISTLNQVDLVLNKSRKKITILERDIAALEKKIADTTRASQDLTQKISANEQYIAKRLVALYKLSWLGRFQMMASAESLHELLQRKTAIARILAYDEKVIGQIMDNRQNLEILRSRLQAHRDEKYRSAELHRQEISRMAVERTKRSRLLAYVRQEMSAQLATIDSLKQAARQLDATIQNLGIELTAAVPDEYIEDKPFEEYKGEPIQAVYTGKILYADWFKGYGNMIILDHGDSYYTVYAHIEEVFKTAGDIVEAGEVMATVGDSGSMTGPKLYFEVRHHGKPLDPLQWLEGG